nr:hypothetical protein HUO10_005300 [Paraburkholderia busanensis]
MRTRMFTYLVCDCGHRGAIIECMDSTAPLESWYQTWLRNLSRTGSYHGDDELFTDTKPGCPVCGRSLGPAQVVGRSTLYGLAELVFPDRGSHAAGVAANIGPIA